MCPCPHVVASVRVPLHDAGRASTYRVNLLGPGRPVYEQIIVSVYMLKRATRLEMQIEPS